MQTRVPFHVAVRVWAKIGCLSFGGPAGQIALMHKELVEERRWIGEARFLHALNYCMLLPGPEAQQLATYVGWLLHGTKGGLAAGVLFVLPGALLMCALSWLYASFAGVGWVAALFFGLKPAVIAIVADALLRVAKRALKSRAQVALAGAAFVALFDFAVPFPWVVLGAGTVGLVAARFAPDAFPSSGARAPRSKPVPAAPAPSPASRERLGGATGAARVDRDARDTRATSSTELEDSVVDAAFTAGELEHTRPSAARALRVSATWLAIWAAPFVAVLCLAGRDSVFFDVASFFSRAAVVTFGGAYAVLAYVAQAAVQSFGWLSTEQMIDGLGLAETTPGPLILVTQFVGFMAGWNTPGELSPVFAGLVGAATTTWVTFAPCFLWIFLGAPFVEALRGKHWLACALSAITAAVVGVIANLSVVFALHVFFGSVGRFEWGPIASARPELASLDAVALALSLVCCIASLRFRTPLAATLALGAAGGAVSYLLRG